MMTSASVAQVIVGKPVLPAKAFRKFFLGLFDHFYRVPHRPLDVPAEPELLVGAGKPAVSRRVLHVDCVREVDGWDEVAHIHGVERLHDVGEQEPVEVHHHREEDIVVLRDPEGHQGCIVCFLHGADVDLQPAGVPLLQGIGVFRPDVPAGPERPVDGRHDHGKPCRGSPVGHLVHVEEPVGARCRKGADTRDTRADAGRHGGVLALDRDVPAFQFPPGNKLCDLLHDLCLRRDRVCGDDCGDNLFYRFGNGLVAGCDLLHGAASSAASFARFFAMRCLRISTVLGSIPLNRPCGAR